jgi:hypothetical protein
MAYKGFQLLINQALHPGDYLETGDGLFVALMQLDGNLVVYPGTKAIGLGPNQEQGAVWASNSYRDSRQCVALTQSDGNFAIYPTPDAVGKAPTEQTGAIWATNTSGAIGGPYFVVLLRHGALTVGSGASGPGMSLLWRSDGGNLMAPSSTRTGHMETGTEAIPWPVRGAGCSRSPKLRLPFVVDSGVRRIPGLSWPTPSR